MKEILNASTGCIIPVGEEFKQYNDTKIYVSKNGWEMSKSSVENEAWFKEKKEEKTRITTSLWGEDEIQFSTSYLSNLVNAKWDYTISKERLAEILIAESKSLLCIIPNPYPVFYTEKELLEVEEAAFNAAREKEEIKRQFNSPHIYNKYPTFSDYKNQQ